MRRQAESVVPSWMQSDDARNLKEIEIVVPVYDIDSLIQIAPVTRGDVGFGWMELLGEPIKTNRYNILSEPPNIVVRGLQVEGSDAKFCVRSLLGDFRTDDAAANPLFDLPTELKADLLSGFVGRSVEARARNRGNRDAYRVAAHRAFGGIADSYPALAEECLFQLAARMKTMDEVEEEESRTKPTS